MARKKLSSVPSQNKVVYVRGDATLPAAEVSRMLEIANLLRPGSKTTIRTLKLKAVAL
jgi:hypothetical protein